ncbi:MAG: glycosyltransferase family 2 protein [Thiolinea sp.]
MFDVFKGIKRVSHQVKILSKELSLSSSFPKPKSIRVGLINWLYKSAKEQGICWLDLLQQFHSMILSQGISNEYYQLWLQYQPSRRELLEKNLNANGSIVSLAKAASLHPSALEKLSSLFNSDPNIQVIYTDHDYLDDSNQRLNPLFKPDWNLDLFLSTNYLGNAVFLRKEWAEKKFEDLASIDYLDLLKVLPNLLAESIFHLPEVLIHFPVSELAKPVGLAIDQTKLKSIDVNIESFEKGSIENSQHLIFNLPSPTPLVSLIIPTRDHLELLQPCIRSILKKTSYKFYELIIVNNQSVDVETLNWLEQIQQQDQRVKVLDYPYPFNYSAINNFAVKQAQGSIIGLVNNDIEVINSGWLDEMVRQASREQIGCVGAKLYYADGRIQHAGVILGCGGGSGHAHRYYPRDSSGYMGRLKLVQNFTAVTGACLLVRKSLYEQVGGLNEKDLPIAWNDIDLCLKVRQLGYRNLWTPYAELYHHESVSRGRDKTKEKRQRYLAEKDYMYRTWKELMFQDPCYNPNLTMIGEGFSLGLPRNIFDR